MHIFLHHQISSTTLVAAAAHTVAGAAGDLTADLEPGCHVRHPTGKKQELNDS